jgi:hypothetical protein
MDIFDAEDRKLLWDSFDGIPVDKLWHAFVKHPPAAGAITGQEHRRLMMAYQGILCDWWLWLVLVLNEVCRQVCSIS